MTTSTRGALQPEWDELWAIAFDAAERAILLQAIENQAPGAETTQWQENALAALRADAGAELARAATSCSPQWWAVFNASYSELRASTRAHKQLRKPFDDSNA